MCDWHEMVNRLLGCAPAHAITSIWLLACARCTTEFCPGPEFGQGFVRTESISGMKRIEIWTNFHFNSSHSILVLCFQTNPKGSDNFQLTRVHDTVQQPPLSQPWSPSMTAEFRSPVVSKPSHNAELLSGLPKYSYDEWSGSKLYASSAETGSYGIHA